MSLVDDLRNADIEGVPGDTGMRAAARLEQAEKLLREARAEIMSRCDRVDLMADDTAELLARIDAFLGEPHP